MDDYREHAPDPRLAPFVSCLWEMRVGAGEPGPASHLRALPDGCFEWVFHCAEPFRIRGEDGRLQRQAASLLAGVTTAAVVLEPSAGAEVIGVRFKPGGARAFLGGSLDRWRDRVLPIEVLEEPVFAEWSERLQGRAPDERAATLQGLLLARGRHVDARASNLSPAVDALLDGRATVDGVARSTGFSARQLHRRFRAEVGVGPKLLMRIGRFQRAAAAIGETTAPLLQIALATGYADQAHLTREFQAFAGTTPARHRAELGSDGEVLGAGVMAHER
jgi:AraC-like DNA-binding protein